MTTPQLKLFKEESDESRISTPVNLRSIRLPDYTWRIGNNIDTVLTKLGYEVSKEGHCNNNKKFVSRQNSPSSYQWGSRALYVYYYSSTGHGTELSLLSSKRRRSEALKIAKELENRVTEDVKEYLEELKDEDFTRRAKEEIPTLQ